MALRIPLLRAGFSEHPHIVLENDDFRVTSFLYASGVEAIRMQNSRGELVILPWMGQMIWDAKFDGHDLTMRNMFRQPKPTTEVVGTYGCFAFHSGLLANGCPSPEDTHPLHGEMACAAMDEAWLEIDGDALSVGGCYEYVMGFGHHYQACPMVVMHKSSALFDIKMTVKNLASVAMPYMDVPCCASTKLIWFAAIYPASLLGQTARAMMSSASCFLITTPVCHYLGTRQAITGSVYHFLISICKLRRNNIPWIKRWLVHSERPVNVKTCRLCQ